MFKHFYSVMMSCNLCHTKNRGTVHLIKDGKIAFIAGFLFYNGSCLTIDGKGTTLMYIFLQQQIYHPTHKTSTS